MKSSIHIVRRSGEKALPISAKVLSSRAEYIGCRMWRYGPEMTIFPLFFTSGIILKLPIFIVKIAQIPKPIPLQKSSAHINLEGITGPLNAIKPTNKNWSMTSEKDVNLLFFIPKIRLSICRKIVPAPKPQSRRTAVSASGSSRSQLECSRKCRPQRRR